MTMRPALLIIIGLFAAAAARALDNSDCFACHSDKTLAKTNANKEVVSLFVD